MADEEDLVKDLLAITKGNIRELRFNNLLKEADYTPSDEPILTLNDTSIFFDTDISGKIFFYAVHKGKAYKIQNVEAIRITLPLATLVDTTHSILMAKMLGVKTNMERYIETIHDIFPEDFDPNLLMTAFEPKKKTREEIMNSIDVPYKEYTIRKTDDYTLYLEDIPNSRTKGVPVPTRYALMIEMENLVDPHILFAWAPSRIKKALQTLF